MESTIIESFWILNEKTIFEIWVQLFDTAACRLMMDELGVTLWPWRLPSPMDLGDSVFELWMVAVTEYANDGEGDDNNSNILNRLDMDIEVWAAVLSILIPPLLGT